MGKRRGIRRTLTLLAVLCVLATGVQTVWAADCEIEQISLKMPDVRIYYRGNQENNYEAYLGGEKLSYDRTDSFQSLGEGVDYYLMLDISASIPDSQFENIKSGIKDFIASKGEKDQCILLTFGDESKVVLNGSETTQDAAAVIDGLKNDDQETVLFQSVIQASGMIDKAAQSEEKRRVIITITDGEDCVTGQATKDEALADLNHKGIPLYAIAVDVGKEDYINSFGEFSRNSGGTMQIFNSGTCAELLNQIKASVMDSYVAVFHSDTNEASNQREDLTVKFLDNGVTDTKEVIPTRWTPDETAPEVKDWSWNTDENNKLKLIFSEKVLGGDTPGNYQIERDGEAVAVASASCPEGDEPSAVLTFDDPLYTGEYTITFSNITDCSMEKNSIKALDSFHLDAEELPKEKNSLMQWILPAACLLILAAAGVTAFVFYRKVKKNKGVIYVDGKATLASNVDVKQHVSTSNLPQKDVTLRIRDKMNGQCEMQVTINGSAMAGRSDDCDIYFDDLKMSRQHFALETDGADVYITDLESSNGTLVNGVRLLQRRKLLSGDEITAGNIQMKILF